MARCPNKNTAEYKALQEIYSSEIATNNIINTFQDLNGVDTFPTLVEADQMLSNQKIAFSLKKKSFGENLLSNLRREKIGHNYLNEFYINSSDPRTKEFSQVVLDSNYKRFLRYLEINNISQDTVTATRTKNSYRIKVNDNLFTDKDMLESSRSWDTNRARNVVMHLKRLFPQVNVKMLSVSAAEEMFNSLPQWKKNNTNFKEVNSFYVDGVAYLIQGRVTDEIAIEEILHPFIDAIKKDNEDLFNSLLDEATTNFPEMVQDIKSAYNKNRSFSDVERDLEIVTQALARHFNREYESTPTQGFLTKVKEALEWFMKVINNLNEYLTGRPLKVSAINANSNFSDIAKLLNTEGIQFKLESRVDGKVRFSLTPKIQKQVDLALSQATTEAQKIVVRNMTHQAQNLSTPVDSFSVGINPERLDLIEGMENSIVTMNKADHVYINSTTDTVYTSATTAIKGTLKNLKDVQLNLDVGNDVDALLDAVITGEKPETAFSELLILDEAKAIEVYQELESVINQLRVDGKVVLSQLVLFDEASKMAGTADVVFIDPDGKVSILDLKTTKNSLSQRRNVIDPVTGIKKTVDLYDVEWDLLTKEKDVIQDLKDNNVKPENGKKYSKEQIKNRQEELAPELYKKTGIKTLSTRAQHNLQIGLYRRMLENMGYEVSDLDSHRAVSTLHFLSGIEGPLGSQKYNGNIKLDTWYNHNPTENLDKINLLIPLIKDNPKTKALRDSTKDTAGAIFKGSEQPIDIPNEQDNAIAEEFTEYATITAKLKEYQLASVNKLKALEQTKKSIFMAGNREQEQKRIVDVVSYLGMVLNESRESQSAAYSALLQDALKQVKTFTEYVQDPINLGKPEYITYVLNFDRFMKTFVGLYTLKDTSEINATQKDLIASLQTEFNKLSGGSNETGGLINKAISDFVKEIIRTRSSNEFGGTNSFFTEENLTELMNYGKDISAIEYQTRDMDTSPDVILAVMAKIYKAKKQELLDLIGQRTERIQTAAQKVLKLSQSNDKEKIFDFMLEFDSDGTFSGRYVKPIGSAYQNLQQSIRQETMDKDGKPLYYIDIDNLEDHTQEEIDYNIDLANKKRDLSNFFRAEEKNAEGTLVDGEYHKYTAEFKAARRAHEYFEPGSKKSFGNWFKLDSVSEREYGAYQAKYFNNNPYTKAIRDKNGEPTGSILKGQSFPSPKVKFREAREVSRSGKVMTSAKYNSIMNPTDALGVAQKEFYQMYVDMFEKDLLKKLPPGTMNQMLGRIPVVQNNFVDKFKDKPNLITKMFANVTKSYNDFTTNTSIQKGVATDELGNMVNMLPVFFTGDVRREGELEVLEVEINALKDKRKKGGIKKDAYDEQLALLDGKYAQLRNRPTANELSRDMGTSLVKFAAMAENFEVMGTIEDTLTAMVKVLEKRSYGPADKDLSTGKWVEGVFQYVGKKNVDGPESYVVRRAKRFMSMIYYENELVNRGMVAKVADGLIQLSSLSYVAFNPFGNFNNYAIGRINNNIESIGGRFYSRKAYHRATREYNKRALPDITNRFGYFVGEVADIATFNQAGTSKNDYDPTKPNSKYEAFVDSFRMMDDMTDIREQGSSTDSKKSWFARATEFGYILQDAAEYNVQTKVGMALLMDTMIENTDKNSPNFGQTLSYYDAFTYNPKTHKNELKEGYDTVQSTGAKVTDQFRYDLRNKIREVNKQIHGNYAKEDRMVMQQSTIGNLAAQFHKWVAPAIRARYQREYFDQNLGWMEGRYISALKFIGYVKEQVVKGNLNYRDYSKGFLNDQTGYTGEGGNADQRAKNKLFGFYRTMGEVGIMLSVFVLSEVLQGLLAGDDDDSELVKRFKNITKYQADRVGKELVMFLPLFGTEQQYQMVKSPIASTRTMGEIGEALSLSFFTPLTYIYKSDKEFRLDSDYVYQRGKNKGRLKLSKNWMDVIPVLYTIQKWDAYLKMDNFYIK